MKLYKLSLWLSPLKFAFNFALNKLQLSDPIGYDCSVIFNLILFFQYLLHITYHSDYLIN